MNNTNYPGRQPGGKAQGPGGECYCVKCGYTTPHNTGDPCYNMICPNCGVGLVRKV